MLYDLWTFLPWTWIHIGNWVRVKLFINKVQHCLWVIRLSYRNGREGLSHLDSFIISVRSQDHASELSGDMSIRRQKRLSGGELCLNSSTGMTRVSKLPRWASSWTPWALHSYEVLGVSFQVCGVVRPGTCCYWCCSHSYLTVAHFPSLVAPLIFSLGF